MEHGCVAGRKNIIEIKENPAILITEEGKRSEGSSFIGPNLKRRILSSGRAEGESFFLFRDEL